MNTWDMYIEPQLHTLRTTGQTRLVENSINGEGIVLKPKIEERLLKALRCIPKDLHKYVDIYFDGTENEPRIDVVKMASYMYIKDRDSRGQLSELWIVQGNPSSKPKGFLDEAKALRHWSRLIKKIEKPNKLTIVKYSLKEFTSKHSIKKKYVIV